MKKQKGKIEKGNTQSEKASNCNHVDKIYLLPTVPSSHTKIKMWQNYDIFLEQRVLISLHALPHLPWYRVPSHPSKYQPTPSCSGHSLLQVTAYDVSEPSLLLVKCYGIWNNKDWLHWYGGRCGFWDLGDWTLDWHEV